MGFIRTILIIVIIYYLVKIITRYLLPFLLGNYVNRKMNDFSEHVCRQQQPTPAKGKKEK